MIDLQNGEYCPSLDEVGKYVRNPVFRQFCTELEDAYQTEAKMDFSKCSWMPGWNIKFKKAGRSLCTIYPNEGYFTVLVVVGKKEEEQIEAMLPSCSSEMQAIYHQTEEGNRQKWLMIDLEDADALYEDVKRFIQVRRGK